MKQLFLVRHAKSDHDIPNLEDSLRPLNERGRKDAPAMAKRFAKDFTTPQAWFCSTAVRAVETAKYFADACNLQTDDIRTAPDLYSFQLRQAVRLMELCDDAFDSAIYFFHNPTIAETINHYTGELLHVPTCAVALIEFDVDSWQLLTSGSGVLKHFDFPKKHR